MVESWFMRVCTFSVSVSVVRWQSRSQYSVSCDRRGFSRLLLRSTKESQRLVVAVVLVDSGLVLLAAAADHWGGPDGPRFLVGGADRSIRCDAAHVFAWHGVRHWRNGVWHCNSLCGLLGHVRHDRLLIIGVR